MVLWERKWLRGTTAESNFYTKNSQHCSFCCVCLWHAPKLQMKMWFNVFITLMPKLDWPHCPSDQLHKLIIKKIGRKRGGYQMMEKQSILHLHLNTALVFPLFSAVSMRCKGAGEGRAWLPESEWVQETEVSIAPVTERTKKPPLSQELRSSRRLCF